MSLSARALRILTSLCVWIFGFAWMTGVILFLVVYGLVRGGGPQLNRHAARLMAHVTRLAYPRFRVVYAAGFDPTRPSVFCQNHVNFMDAHVACRVIPGPFCGLMLASHFKIPAYGWIMRITSGIPVPSGRGGRTTALMAAARDRIARGLSILVFPEAHRTLDGHVQPFKHGVFYMARDAGAPVVPIAVHGLRGQSQGHLAVHARARDGLGRAPGRHRGARRRCNRRRHGRDAGGHPRVRRDRLPARARGPLNSRDKPRRRA
jgi:1-acyl-sn-glycerol-3-phosphate acyltransferase